MAEKLSEYKTIAKKYDGAKRKKAKEIIEEYEKWIKDHPDEEVQVYEKKIEKLCDSFINI